MEQYIIEGNKKLCRLMGHSVTNETVVIGSGQRLSIDEYRFHSDWGELMPVVEKIKKLIPNKPASEFTIDEIKANCITKLFIISDINIVWRYAVEFANFYLSHPEFYE